MGFETLDYQLDGTTAVITLNRPDRMNAWNATMASELGGALTDANSDDAVRAVVLTGAGRAFCAGADLQGGGDTFAGRDSNGDRPERPAAPVVYPWQIDKPVIAAINGAAVGVGMTYPMLCDIRFAAETAKMGFVFTRRGMIPELAAHLLVQRVAGFSNAADLLMSGRIFTGAEAAQLGIVTKAVPAADVLELALAKAGEYALAAPVSVGITKRLLWQGLHSSQKDMLAVEGPLFAWAGNQADAREGVQSFIEKRDPDWKLSVARDMPEVGAGELS